MNLLELGDLLKREREKRGLSVRDVMESTKISRRNLNALEGGEVKLLPHPVYLKGYVRNYARLVGLVGLEGDSLVAVVEQQSNGDSGYLPQSTPAVPAPEPAPLSASALTASEVAPPKPSGLSQPVPAEPAQPDPAQPEPIQPEPRRAESAPEPQAEPESQIRFPKPAGLAPKPNRRAWPWIVLLIIAGVMAVLYVQYQRIQADADQPKPSVAAPAPAENATNVAAEANATLPEENATLPEANATQSIPAPESVPVPAAGHPTPDAKPLPPQGQEPKVSATPVEVSRKPQAAATPSAPQAPAVRTPGMQQLVITAKPNESCWVEVSEGAQRKSFVLKNGDSRRFEFSNKAKVRLGNAGGVSFQLNGASYPFEGERGATATLEIGAH
ncbi:MAG: DUF4115 domain-containing protein [Humidesulfovibrio sp.]|nr:DUF4115 domain-containing protein [Humidesulfovibrio sp.]